MRGTTLQNLIAQLRAECRLSTNNSRGLENRDYLAQVIKRNYELIYSEFDWPHLKVLREDCQKTLAAGQRHYDFPAELDVDTITGAWLQTGGEWVPLPYGIGFQEYAQFDSESDVRVDPTLRWDVRSEDQFEVWPIPASNGDIVGFEGKRKFVQLVDDSDEALIDDLVIVLFSAAEVLAAMKQDDAPKKEQMASARLNKLKAITGGNSRVRVGGVDPHGSRAADNNSRLRVVYAR